MQFQPIYGLNEHILGIILKEMGTRALRVVTQQLSCFTQEVKHNEHKATDLVTSADHAAQEQIVRIIRECLPFAGIIAEEHGLRVEPTGGISFWVTIDPVDGTKALGRKQSDGIGILIGFVLDGVIIASLVVDIMTGEFYYYRPNSNTVHRLHHARHEKMTFIPTEKKRVLLFDDPRIYSSLVQSATEPDNGFFSSVDVSNGSIGTNMAKLWKGEVSAVITKAVFTNSWDYVPVVGICQKLGFIFKEITSEGLKPTLYDDPIDFASKHVGEIICIHKSDLAHFRSYCENNKLFLAAA